LRQQYTILGIVFIGLLASTASAEEICPQLTQLLKDPPSGFVANRGEPISPQSWASKPFLANANCVVSVARVAEAHEMRCTVNDGTKATLVTQYYQDTAGSVDRCLAALPEGKKYNRQEMPVDSEGLKGAETRWIYDSDALRFQIDLSNYRRTFDGSTYNSFSVEYLRY
jgi:hypothetical protein